MKQVHWMLLLISAMGILVETVSFWPGILVAMLVAAGSRSVHRLSWQAFVLGGVRDIIMAGRIGGSSFFFLVLVWISWEIDKRFSLDSWWVSGLFVVVSFSLYSMFSFGVGVAGVLALALLTLLLRRIYVR